MERREPTLSTGGMSEQPESAPRRQQPQAHDHDDDLPPARSTRRPTPQSTPAYVPASPSSSLPTVALVIALVAAGGAGFLGWQLFQAQEMLKQADVRIQGLEQQLSLTSEESSASVVTLQSNLKKMDVEQRRIVSLVEANRKAIAANAEKTTAVARDAANAQKLGADAKAGVNSLKQEVAANKTVADAAAAKIDGMSTSVSQQTQVMQNLRYIAHSRALETGVSLNRSADTSQHLAAILSSTAVGANAPNYSRAQLKQLTYELSTPHERMQASLF